LESSRTLKAIDEAAGDTTITPENVKMRLSLDTATTTNVNVKVVTSTSIEATTTTLPSPVSVVGLAVNRGQDAKDRRAHEVARQNNRRRGDRAKAREQKKRLSGLGGSDGAGGRVSKGGAAITSVLSPLELLRSREDAKMTRFESFDDIEDDEKVTGNNGAIPLEVALEDLIRVGKVRKGRVGDFEVIPSIPSVIVLDDKTFADSVLDEAWEHIPKDSPEDIVEKTNGIAPSYAQVVSATRA